MKKPSLRLRFLELFFRDEMRGAEKLIQNPDRKLKDLVELTKSLEESGVNSLRIYLTVREEAPSVV